MERGVYPRTCSESEEERQVFWEKKENKNYDIGKEAADAQIFTYHYQGNVVCQQFSICWSSYQIMTCYKFNKLKIAINIIISFYR